MVRTIVENDTVSFWIESDYKNVGYQWYQNLQSGYVSLNNVSYYSGTRTNKLMITNAPKALDSSQYFCVVTTTQYNCQDSSRQARLTVTNTTNIESLTANANKLLTVYPNPVSTNIQILGLGATNANYQIYNAEGKMIQSGMIQSNSIINIEELPIGIYSMNIIQPTFVQSFKLLKQ
jgi:hypothetical protein